MKKESFRSKRDFRPKKISQKRKRYCFFCAHNVVVDYKDVETLKKYITGSGKILSRRITHLCARHQRAFTRAIKQARIMALLPFIRTK